MKQTKTLIAGSALQHPGYVAEARLQLRYVHARICLDKAGVLPMSDREVRRGS
jgi:hypothetical protein